MGLGRWDSNSQSSAARPQGFPGTPFPASGGVRGQPRTCVPSVRACVRELRTGGRVHGGGTAEGWHARRGGRGCFREPPPRAAAPPRARGSGFTQPPAHCARLTPAQDGGGAGGPGPVTTKREPGAGRERGGGGGGRPRPRPGPPSPQPPAPPCARPLLRPPSRRRPRPSPNRPPSMVRRPRAQTWGRSWS